MLVYAVEAGTGLNARIPAYQVAGKTGTARIPLPDRAGYYENQYVASFIGFLPASDPQLVIATVLDRPTTAYGGIAAAPLFREIAEYGIARLGITPAAPIGLPPRLLPAP
jgi:cell division protein FtsI (penicillin-binding protein 3)